MSYSVKENPLVLPLIGESDELEVDVIDQETGEISDLNRLARNLFRYIVRGTEVNGSSNEIKQGLKIVEHALTKTKSSKINERTKRRISNNT